MEVIENFLKASTMLAPVFIIVKIVTDHTLDFGIQYFLLCSLNISSKSLCLKL